MRASTIFVVFASAALLWSGPGHAQDGTSNTILFQTRVETPEGDPIPDGNYPVRFSIYATESDSTTLWSETQTLVEITDGLSNTILFGETPPPADLFDQWDSLWLEVAIDRDNDGFDPEDIFNPRTPLHAVPFALYAKDAGSLGGTPAGEYAKSADVTTELETLESSVTSAQDAQDAAIAMKADAAEVYTKAEIDSQQGLQDEAIDDKADAAAVEAALLSKADAATVQSEQDAQDTAIAGKADLSSVLQWQVVNTGGIVPAQRNFGYVISANLGVSVVLPLSNTLVAGDIIRVSGASLSGWQVNQNAGQRILSQSLPFPQIPATWNSAENTRIWSSVACSADGRSVVACDGGTPGPVVGSSDGGMFWSQYLFGGFWRSLAMSADGQTILVADDSPGVLYVSDDGGLNWLGRESSRKWSSVAVSADATHMVAAVTLGGYLYTSDDSGATWTQRESTRDWSSVSCSSDGSVMLASANPGQLYVSTDYGETWVARDTARQWRSVAMSADGSRMIAAAYGDWNYVSTNGGANWSPVYTTGNWACVASSSNGQILAAGLISGNIYVSTDGGAKWTAVADSRVWRSLAMSADGSRLFGAAENSTLYGATASVGTTGRVTSPGSGGGLRGSAYSAVELQYVGNDTFLPISSSGSIAAF
ncbi:MAG: hypothetical protein GC168_13770 [Candidatus Hydrogenedens sp.]|nr:hypothetical protein [Candidatus Hydrogenedens sp.]